MSGVFCIAEVGQAHEGSLGILHSYIDALSETSVDAIKFQTHIAEAESSPYEPFRVKFSKVDATRFDYWKRMSFSKSQWIDIKAHCEDVNVEFMSSPFSVAAVELLEEIGIKRYKIGSGELSNHLMLDAIGRTGKPVILSSGMSSYEELSTSVDYLTTFGADLSILQCTTSYPTTAENVGLNVIQELKSRFPQCTIGFSDHSGNIYTGLAAVTLGADILEFHTVFDKRMFGPDATSSLTIDETRELIRGVRFLHKARQSPVDKNDTARYKELRSMFGKSLAVNKDLPKGHIIQQEDLESKKPGDKGLAASDFKAVIGKKLLRPMTRYEFLNAKDLTSAL